MYYTEHKLTNKKREDWELARLPRCYVKSPPPLFSVYWFAFMLFHFHVLYWTQTDKQKTGKDWELARLPRCYVKLPTAQDVFWPIPGLISCTGMTRGLLYMNLMHKMQSGAWPCPSRPNLSCWLFMHVVGRNTYWCVKMTWRQLLLMLLYNRRLRCYTLQTVILESHSTEQKHSIVPVQQIVAP